MYLHIGRAEPAPTAQPEVAATPRSLPLTRVRDTRLLPFGLICRIVTRSYDKPGFSVGTGVLISRHHVLTCAHNIYPRQAPRTKTIDVIPMQNGPDGKWPAFRANGWAIRPGWQVDDCRTVHLDLGILRLARPATSVFWPLHRFDPAQLVGVMADMAGYPGTREPAGRHMYRSRGRVDGTLIIHRCTHTTAEGRLVPTISETTDLIAHGLDTAPSQSGGPMWILQEGRRILFALHAGRIDQDRRGKAVLLNAGVRRLIARWVTRTLPPI